MSELDDAAEIFAQFSFEQGRAWKCNHCGLIWPNEIRQCACPTEEGMKLLEIARTRGSKLLDYSKCDHCGYELVVYPHAEPGHRERVIANEHVGCEGTLQRIQPKEGPGGSEGATASISPPGPLVTPMSRCLEKNAGWECQLEVGHDGPHSMRRGGWRIPSVLRQVMDAEFLRSKPPELHDYQRDVLDQLDKKPGVILGWDKGTGK